MKMSGLFSLLVSILAMTMWGCSDSYIPSEAAARAVFESKWARGLKNGTVEIRSFKKTNGRPEEFAGRKLYVVEYEAELVFPKGHLTDCLRNPPPMNCIPALSMPGATPPKKPGESEIKKGEIALQKTEKGWQALK